MRRHTRCLSDWSSDVCSSDLEIRPQAESEESAVVEDPRGGQLDERRRAGMTIRPQGVLEVARVQEAVRGEKAGRLRRDLVRSEERRVGRECRARTQPTNTEAR